MSGHESWASRHRVLILRLVASRILATQEERGPVAPPPGARHRGSASPTFTQKAGSPLVQMRKPCLGRNTSGMYLQSLRCPRRGIFSLFQQTGSVSPGCDGLLAAVSATRHLSPRCFGSPDRIACDTVCNREGRKHTQASLSFHHHGSSFRERGLGRTRATWGSCVPAPRRNAHPFLKQPLLYRDDSREDRGWFSQPLGLLGPLLTLKYLNNKQLLMAPEVNTKMH